MSWWKTKTKTGRVVYDRKKNPFTYCDLLRVARSLGPLNVFEPDKYFREFACLKAAQWILTSRQVETAARNTPRLLALAAQPVKTAVRAILERLGFETVERVVGEEMRQLLEESVWAMDLLFELGSILGRSTSLPSLPASPKRQIE